MHMKKKEEKWIKPRSVSERFWIGWIESHVGEDTIWQCRVWKVLHYKDTIHRHNKRLMFRYYYWKTLILSV
ncbi:hypothetical protein T05_502 [Trichinella murrelli]|uniref:Uncharacterized protein n=1 Tax=Trichinella murrelli TaxID=144512 RepID=A0A0V0U636_9BILA|nr:hypothetical protein T05_502 [Trichinella murrelli]